MAAPVENLLLRPKLYQIILIYSVSVGYFGAESSLMQLQPKEILLILENACVFAANVNADVKTSDAVAKLQAALRGEPAVVVGTVKISEFIWPSGEKLRWKDSKTKLSIESSPMFFFAKRKVDRNCLLTPAQKQRNPAIEPFSFPISSPMSPPVLEVMVDFINSKCGTFRTTAGRLSVAGIHRQNILENLFIPESITDITMGKILDCSKHQLSNLSKNSNMHKSFACEKPLSHGHCDKSNSDEIRYDGVNNCDTCSVAQNQVNSQYTKDPNTKIEMAKCGVLNSLPSTEEFFHQYLKLSKPVIIKNATRNWPAHIKWSHKFFYDRFGNNDVHVKLTQGGDFEGVEKAELWEDFTTFQIPKDIYKQLPYPDLVVVRPAGVNMKFSKFLDLITWAANQPERNVSAYLEYSSIPEYMPELEIDILNFDFIRKELQRRHLNLWLSDGNTIGRLHFDPFDNLLCQIKGRKEVILFDPHDNTRLYEGHIPQAMLGYNEKTKKFRKKTLEDSTSMVMSPVNIREPDIERFERFTGVVPLNCTIDEGDVLFMPAFWWHEVYSYPNKKEKRNLAVNLWYEPFLTKEFPCPECKLDVNPFYHHLL